MSSLEYSRISQSKTLFYYSCIVFSKETYNDSQTAYCLQTIAALISNANKLGNNNYSLKLDDLSKLQDSIFERSLFLPNIYMIFR